MESAGGRQNKTETLTLIKRNIYISKVQPVKNRFQHLSEQWSLFLIKQIRSPSQDWSGREESTALGRGDRVSSPGFTPRELCDLGSSVRLGFFSHK